MADVARTIDRLYQAPLAAFVAERRAAAKAHPAEAATLAALEKPSLPAWAVNQVFWTKRPILDRLIRAAARVRDLELGRLSGRAVEMTDAEGARRAALERAMDAATDILAAAGAPSSPATLQQIRETLDTLPWTSLDGRLTRPVRSTGLEAMATIGRLAATARAGHVTARTPAVVVPLPPSPSRVPDGPAPPNTRADRRRRRERAALERTLRAAREAERRASRAAASAAARVARATRGTARATAALDAARAALDTAHRVARETRARADEATRQRAALEQQLERLKA